MNAKIVFDAFCAALIAVILRAILQPFLTGFWLWLPVAAVFLFSCFWLAFMQGAHQ